jgi:tRNA pseudouridine38-40 synthase
VAKIKCIITYDGSNFHGFQVQPQKRTVQGEIEQALRKIHKGEYVRVHASGRTDTGVHAMGQTIHFETTLNIPGNSWKKAMNTLLPDDLFVKDSEVVAESFHARYDVLEKEYHYFILNAEDPNIFNRNFMHHFPYRLNVAAMQEACKYLEGTHDFTTFSSAKATVKGNKVRTVYEASCHQNGEMIEFVFRGSGFLYNMVRIIVGTILDIGQGRLKPTDIHSLLEKKDRKYASKTAPANGLFLWKVRYK